MVVAIAHVLFAAERSDRYGLGSVLHFIARAASDKMEATRYGFFADD